MAVDIKPGRWGGRGVIFTVNSDSASIEFDCATATIPSPLRTKKDGSFEFFGSLFKQTFGPVSPNSIPKRQEARFTGQVNNDQMKLIVAILDPAEKFGEFSLKFGESPEMTRCR